MKTKALCLLCTMLVGAMAFADDQPQAQDDVRIAVPVTANHAAGANLPAQQAFAEKGQLSGGGRGGPRAGEDCPQTGFLCGQDETGNTWLYSDLGFSDGAGHTGRVTSEQFPPPGVANLTQAIGVVTFYGTYIDGAAQANGCTKAHNFRIEFYNDLAPPQGTPPMPDAYNPTHTYTLVPAVSEDVGDLSFGGTVAADKWQHVLVLPAAVNKPFGHFSIASATITAGCYNLVGPSLAPEGNSATWRWWVPLAPGLSAFDMRYCFAINTPGNCCIDQTATCGPSTEYTCALQGGRFTTGSCASLNPACGQATGACCAENNTCTITISQACTGTSIWLGPNTVCTQCCTVYCSGGGFTAEAELECDDPNWADVNSGCFVEGTPLFHTIACNQTICGTTGLYEVSAGCKGDTNCNNQVDFADINPFVNALLNAVYCDATGYNADVSNNGTVGFEDINPFVALLTQNPLPIICQGGGGGLFNDVDVYRYTSAQPTVFTWRVRSEVDLQPQVWNAQSNNCVDDWIVDFEGATPCVDTSVVTRCLPAGTYYFTIVNGVGGTPPNCGWDYRATLVCTTPCEPCLVTCPGGATQEGEGCGGDTNLGCSGPTPYQFTQLTFDPNGQIVVCGSLFADDGTRDLDYYTFDIQGPTQTEFTISNEMPIESSVYAKDPFPTAAGCDDAIYVYVDRFYPACGPTTKSFYLPAGTWVFYVIPANSVKDIFYGYPCFTGDNDYVLSITAPEPNCPTLMDAACTGAPAEGEPACFNGYVDNFNPGCDVADPNTPGPMINITPGNDLCGLYSGGNDYILCGKAGAYITGTQKYDSDWFVFTLGAGDFNYVCIGGQGEMPLDYDFYDAALGCAGTPLYSGFFAACTASPDEDPIPPYNVGDPVPAALPAGTYWLRIGLAAGADTTPCSADYGLILGCRQCPEAVK